MAKTSPKRLSPKAALAHLSKVLRKAPVDGWEIYISQSRTLEVEAEDGKVDSLSRSLSMGAGVRTLVGGAPGFAYTTDFSSDALEQLAKRSVEAARVATPDPAVAFAVPAKLTGRELAIEDPELARISERKKIEQALLLEEAAKSADARIQTVRNALYSEEAGMVMMRNSLGLSCEASETAVSASVMAVAGPDGESESGFDFQDGRRFKDLKAARVGKSAAHKAIAQMGARQIKGKTGPVIIENLAACELLEILISSFCADEVQKGKSALAGKLGKQVFNPAISIVDDGLLKGALGTFPFDDEGVPRRRTVVARNGMLEAFLYDTTSARRDGVQSTGNAVRGGDFQASPGVGVTNCFIRKGKESLPELIKTLGNGLLVRELMGVHNANPITGEYSFGCSGNVIERGEIAYPFRGVAIAGNLFDLFLAAEETGSDLRFFGEIGSPSLLVGRVTVSGE